MTEIEIFYSAIQNADIETVEQILAHGVDWDACEKQKETPLTLAVRTGKWKIVRLLARQGAKAFASSHYHQTPLNRAFEKNQMDSVRFLFHEAYETGAGKIFGENSLWHEAEKGSFETVQWLVNHGVDPYFLQRDGDNLLHAAAGSGNFALVKYLVESLGLDFRKRNVYGRTPIFNAAESGNQEMVRWFLETLNLSCYVRDHEDYTLLHYAAKSGNLALVQWLVNEKKLNVNAKTSLAPHETWEETPLHCAAQNHWEIVRWLVEQGADVNARIGLPEDSEVIFKAIAWDNPEMVQWLLEHGAKERKELLLRYALKHSQWRIAQWFWEQEEFRIEVDLNEMLGYFLCDNQEAMLWLIQHGAEIPDIPESETEEEEEEQESPPEVETPQKAKESPVKTEEEMQTLLFKAVRSSNEWTLLCLLEQGISPEAMERLTRQVWNLWPLGTFTNVLWILKNFGVNLDALDWNERFFMLFGQIQEQKSSCPDWARLEILEYITKLNVPISFPSPQEANVFLSKMIRLGKKSLVSHFWSSGTFDFFQTPSCVSALFEAAEQGFTETVQWLVNHGGVNVHARNAREESLLLAALKSGSEELVRWLIERGLRLSAPLPADMLHGRTLLHYAACKNYRWLADWLIRQGMDVNAQTRQGDSVLQAAVEFADFEMVQLLLRHGADVHAVVKESRSFKSLPGYLSFALHEAEAGNWPLACFWVEQGKDLNNPGGSLLLDLAVSTASPEQIRFLLEHGADVSSVPEIIEHAKERGYPQVLALIAFERERTTSD